MNVKYDVLCYGAISLDISGRVAGLSRGTQESATSYEIFPGGDAALVALTLAGLGWKVALAGGPIGRDPMGDYLRLLIAGAGIDMYVDFEGKTSVAAVAIDQAGERTSITYHENTPLEKISVPLELVPMSSCLYACGCYGRNAALMGERAQAQGIASVLNANSDSVDFYGSFRAAIAGEANVRQLGPTPAEAATAIHERGAKLAIVTMGERGCVCRGEENAVLPAYKVAAVDCTGAGAAFAAGFIDAGLLGMELPETAPAGYRGRCTEVHAPGQLQADKQGRAGAVREIPIGTKQAAVKKRFNISGRLKYI